MKNLLVFCAALLMLAGCKNKSDVKRFTVKGSIINNPNAKKIYLEEIPMTTMQRVIVDSATLGKDGKFSMSAGASDARTYTLRLDQQSFPLIAVINDVSTVTVDGRYAKENLEFPDSVNVQGSPASTNLKMYMRTFNDKMQDVFTELRLGDSLSKIPGKDSSLREIDAKLLVLATDAKAITNSFINDSKNPALTMFILGYYQTTSNQQGLHLLPYTNKEVKQIVNDAVKKHPDHTGLASIQSTLQGWIGKQAPDFTLPDPTGKQISLSSLRGKYVLIDFWASWCMPCRQENPNVVKAYNKFKDKNFTILGVSLDRPDGKDAWVKAIMDDKLTWQHVSDLKFWQSEVVNLYKFGEAGIPYNVLVDPQGKILAERLTGPALDSTLTAELK